MQDISRDAPGLSITISRMELAVAVVLVIVGLAGIILPAIPGTVLIFAGLWFAAWGVVRLLTGTHTWQTLQELG